ncbi:MAG: ABC transporter permease [Candidatus Dormiibacterota bacterium]
MTIILFVLLHLLPGGPARALLGNHASGPSIRAFDLKYGLTEPLPVQYLSWAGQLLHGNLGSSYKQGVSVDTLLAANLPRTLLLAGVATMLAMLVAIPLGVFQAVRRNSVPDYAITVTAFIFYAMPTFFLGIILIALLSQLIPLLPSTGPTAAFPLMSQVPNLVLPILTLALVNLALFSRYMRSSALDSLLQDYVRTARSKGVSGRDIVLRHVLKNALLPMITLLGLSLPAILSGALVTEALFNYPGIGLLFWNAAQNDDYPVLLGTATLAAVGVVAGSLVADLLYLVADPRVRYR